jgi:tRNA threonylcarbamoyladenosine modification (KEOPS) complex Cgi121 subunit
MKVFKVESGLSMERLCEALDRLDAVALRPDTVESLEELELAFHLAKKAFEKKKNIAKKLKYEFLLWLSGTRDISSAIKRTSPKGKQFLLAVFSERKKLPAELKEKRMGLSKRGKSLRLERISLSRIRS